MLWHSLSLSVVAFHSKIEISIYSHHYVQLLFCHLPTLPLQLLLTPIIILATPKTPTKKKKTIWRIFESCLLLHWRIVETWKPSFNTRAKSEIRLLVGRLFPRSLYCMYLHPKGSSISVLFFPFSLNKMVFSVTFNQVKCK